jgi:peptidoglycan/xylan/chitin deacetylase (PgdA/CDA1 family)
MVCAFYGTSIIHNNNLQKTIAAIAAGILLSIGCEGLTFILPVPTSTSEPTWTISPLPTPTVTATDQPTISPTETITQPLSETPLPTFTFTPTASPVPQWIFQGPNEIVIPILLYHHIGISPSESPYYVSAYAFEQQMYLLRQWGYQTISVEMLVTAINEGAFLPPKPIILTFDDGSESVFTTALPIMQKYDFTGTAYIVHNYIGLTNDFMEVDQIRVLYGAGWEIASHSISHVDLTKRTDRQRDEIVDSRIKLQRRLGVPILSFAYPFGAYNEDSVHYVHFAGYIGAVGLGNDTRQSGKNLFYLYRKDVNGFQDLKTFASFLPWQKDLNDLPIVTIIP